MEKPETKKSPELPELDTPDPLVAERESRTEEQRWQAALQADVDYNAKHNPRPTAEPVPWQAPNHTEITTARPYQITRGVWVAIAKRPVKVGETVLIQSRKDGEWFGDVTELINPTTFKYNNRRNL